MARKPRLTPAEWQIMEVVWELGGSPSVRDVLERAFPKGEKAYTTVQTVMNTLEKKGLLRHRKVGLVNFYQPTRTREALLKAEMSSLVTRVFRGSIPAVANTLLELDDLDLEEIRQIKALVDRKERQLEGDDHD
jgi:BlaI family penicillinase repressor